MARYRKIDVRMWGDAWFQGLTPIQPCGQGLWFYLLTGEATGIIPGLMRIGEAALAEALGWPLDGFREAFSEVSRDGKVKADWKARVVWVTNAVRFNEPASPNVIRSWREAWDEIPECRLKHEAWRSLGIFAQSMGEGFAKAFREVCPEPSRKPLPNQEQEQEQDLAAAGARKRSKRSDQLGSEAPPPVAPPPPVAAAYDPIPQSECIAPGTAGPAEASTSASASDLQACPPAQVYPAEAGVSPDDPPPRPLRIVDEHELGTMGAELRYRLESRADWKFLVAAAGRQDATRQALEAVLAQVGADRSEALCWSALERRKRQGLQPPKAMAFFVPLLEEVAAGGDPMPAAAEEVDPWVAIHAAEHDRKWGPVYAAATPEQRQSIEEERDRLVSGVKARGLWTSAEAKELEQVDDFMVAKWSKRMQQAAEAM